MILQVLCGPCGFVCELSAGITNGQVAKAAESIVPRLKLGDVALVAAPDGVAAKRGMATGTFVL
jgi:hypothetical protein